MTQASYRSRCLSAMSLSQIKSLPNNHEAIVILSVGAIEQHGPHLPVGVDAFLGQIFLENSLALLPEALPVYVAPPIQVAKSNEHVDFPGSLIISRESLRKKINAVGQQLELWGFKHLYILNTHGGNASVVKSALRELSLCSSLNTGMLKLYTKYPLTSGCEEAFGIHAGEFETSIISSALPSLVNMELATCEWIGSEDAPGSLRAEFSPATYAWKTKDISESGVMGDATKGTPEKGAIWISEIAESLAEALTALLQSSD